LTHAWTAVVRHTDRPCRSHIYASRACRMVAQMPPFMLPHPSPPACRTPRQQPMSYVCRNVRSGQGPRKSGGTMTHLRSCTLSTRRPPKTRMVCPPTSTLPVPGRQSHTDAHKARATRPHGQAQIPLPTAARKWQHEFACHRPMTSCVRRPVPVGESWPTPRRRSHKVPKLAAEPRSATATTNQDALADAANSPSRMVRSPIV
jgi:hypothetical protein